MYVEYNGFNTSTHTNKWFSKVIYFVFVFKKKKFSANLKILRSIQIDYLLKNDVLKTTSFRSFWTLILYRINPAFVLNNILFDIIFIEWD